MSNKFFEESKAWMAFMQTLSKTNNDSFASGSTSLIEGEESSSEFSKSERPLEDKKFLEKLLEIHLQNYREKLSVYKPIISAVIDQPDFKPVSFLQLGLEKSCVVCRISRYYSKDDLKKGFKNLKETAKELDKYLDKLPLLNPSEELRSIFLIPNKLFDEIFSEKNECASKKTFLDSVECLEKSIDEILKLNPLPLGTGFLVGNSHLLTNNHVIPTPEIAQKCVAQFGYEDEPTKIVKILDYEFDSKLLFVTNPQLDYTLVQLQTDAYSKRPAGYNFGWLDLIESEDDIASGLNKDQVEKLINKLNNDGYSYTPEKLKFYGLTKGNELEGDRVAIIQHPKGRKKEIILQNNEVTGLSLENLDYKADTDYGSSGSPVFNMNWKLVALTKKVIPALLDEQANQQGSQISDDNRSNTQSLTFSWNASQGTRICRIVEDLKIKSFTNPKLKSFVEDFVFTSEQLQLAPLPSGLEFDGESSYVDLSVEKTSDTLNSITVEVWVQRYPDSGDGSIIHQVNTYSLYWAVGKLFLRLYSNSFKDKFFDFNTQACLTDGLWHHVAFIYNFTDNFTYNLENPEKPKEPIIYIDGQKQKIYTKQNVNSNFSDQLKNPIQPEDNLYRIYVGNYFKGFKGSISEIRFWKVVREQQITDNMNRRLDATKEVDLLGYWRFEEGEGYKVYNLASKSLAAKQPKVEDSSDDKIKFPPRCGLEFNGICDYVDCGHDTTLDFQEAITIEAWVKLNKKLLEGEGGFIINRGASWGEPGYSLWFLDEKKIRIELCDDKKSQRIFDTEHDFAPDTWHHIAFTWSIISEDNQTFQRFQTYIDGNKEGIKYSTYVYPENAFEQTFPKEDENICSLPEENKDYFQTGIGKPKVNLNIGRAQNYAYYFNGSIAEVRLWNIARTEQQIQENMHRRLDTDIEQDLVAYWRLDEEEGDKANDSSKNAMVANVYGGKWLKPYSLMEQDVFGVAFKTKRLTASQYPALPLPFGLKFSNKKYYPCDNDDKLNTPKAITVEAWVKQTFGDCLIVNCVNGNEDLQQDSDIRTGYSLSWYEGKVRVILSDAVSKNRTIVYSKNAPSDNMWHHIAFTWSLEAEGEIAIYIDGRYQDCIVEGKSNALIIQGRSKTTGIFTGVLDNLKTNLTIGQRINNENDTYRDFEIAEVRLWDVVRTQQQIQANMYRRLNPEYFQSNGDKEGLEEQNNLDGLVGYWRLDEANAQEFLKKE